MRGGGVIFSSKLIEGVLVKRYKRFFADIELLDGQVITAHCANTGSMRGVLSAGNKVWVSKSDDPKRKLSYSWQSVEVDGIAIGINTHNPNKLVHEALVQRKIKALLSYNHIRSEVKYGEENSRIDFLLSDDEGRLCYLEVKNVHFSMEELGKKTAIFPDSVTARGTKHLNELMGVVAQGHRAVVVYCVQRSDCERLRFGVEFDPVYATTAIEAMNKGVEMFSYSCKVNPDGIVLNGLMQLIKEI